MTAIGITGTANGWTPEQETVVSMVLGGLADPAPVFHHGGCAGVDEQAADLAERLGYRVTIHPDDSIDETKHNREIVDASDLLIGVPYGDEEWPGSGTWYTINYAREVGVPVFVVGPTGRILQDTRGTLTR
jgi:hypothetical protein